MAFALYFTLTGDGGLRAWLVTGLVCLWGLRLTLNWASHWRGLGHEDWRYVDLRVKTGRAYWAVSFVGLHLYPTVMVLATSAGLYVATTRVAPVGVLDGVAACVTLAAIAIEAVADRQLHAFIRDNTDPQRFMDRGLWRWSRHPNYFGEVSFWWGLCLFGFAADRAAYWLVAGPAALTAMFLFVSIPMMEKRMLEKRPAYRAHQQRTSVLLPLPPR
jgi:steroid 5-alpha reductase family enzyme